MSSIIDEAEAARHRRLRHMPWERTSADLAALDHRERLRWLEQHAGARIADDVYVSDGANILTESLVLGERCIVAADALLRGDLIFGRDCSVNSFATLSGTVRMGDGVRIASGASVVGFNHGFGDASAAIHRQPLTSLGIEIGRDVWVGANVVVVDGARIGDGVVVAAGAVVRGQVPAYSIVGGVPARVIGHRDGRSVKRSARRPARAEVETFGQRVADQWPQVLETFREGKDYVSCSADGTWGPALRHLCDAVEIAAGFQGLDRLKDRDEIAARLSAAQDQVTGLFPDPFRARIDLQPLHQNPVALYNVLAAGYALECLGSAPEHPVTAVELSAEDMGAWLDGLTWERDAWMAGAVVDAIGTGLMLNRRHFRSGRTHEALFGWLALHVDALSGLWGAPTPDEGLLRPVNGFYRLTRGTYAQFGVPVPHPEAAIDSVLANLREHKQFEGDAYNACNVLDTIHPLWLCLQQCDHRRAEAELVAQAILSRAPTDWEDGRGFAFAPGQAASLQGTEMWLSIVHVAASLLKLDQAFPFKPQGIHRLRSCPPRAGVS